MSISTAVDFSPAAQNTNGQPLEFDNFGPVIFSTPNNPYEIRVLDKTASPETINSAIDAVFDLRENRLDARAKQSTRALEKEDYRAHIQDGGQLLTSTNENGDVIASAMIMQKEEPFVSLAHQFERAHNADQPVHVFHIGAVIRDSSQPGGFLEALDWSVKYLADKKPAVAKLSSQGGAAEAYMKRGFGISSVYKGKDRNGEIVDKMDLLKSYNGAYKYNSNLAPFHLEKNTEGVKGTLVSTSMPPGFATSVRPLYTFVDDGEGGSKPGTKEVIQFHALDLGSMDI